MGRVREDGQYDKRYKDSDGDPTSDLIIWILGLIPWWLYLIGGLFFLYNWQCNEEVLDFEHEMVNGVEQIVTIDLNVREEPSSSAEILEVLSKDSKVIVSDELIKGWVLVADKDTNAIGYVFAKYVKE